MEGYLLLADGTRLDGVLKGAARTATGWLVANTAVVGFQEMVTDPTYGGAILNFTYPEIGNVGVTEAFSESGRVQAAAVVVKVLSTCRSHYLAEDDFEEMLRAAGVPCLCDVDTRGVAVHLREAGEMPAAVAPSDADPAEIGRSLESFGRPVFRPSGAAEVRHAGAGPKVAVLDLGVRQSDLAQMGRCCVPALFPFDSSEDEVMSCGPSAVVISDGPAAAAPPAATVDLARALVGQVPVLGCGLGHVALGLALGCKATLLKRGHHGANYPVRNVLGGEVGVTQQRHSVVLDRASVGAASGVEVVWENINDGTVEGIVAADGAAVGFQPVLAAPYPGAVNAHLEQFLAGLGG